MLEWQIYYFKFYKKFIKNILRKYYLYYNSMNNNLTFSYNNKVYKTEAAMKKAKAMDANRAIKQAKREGYAVSKKAFKRQQTDFSKQILKIGSKYMMKKKRKKLKLINKRKSEKERNMNQDKLQDLLKLFIVMIIYILKC